ncbi:hypothetical protein MMC15_002885 [Xylographa vitiligo]|nr:hypothetical protein [Xylographa vitiligo]
MAAYLLPTFKTVSVTFALSAVATGVQAIVDPVGFSKFFGLALRPTSTDPVGSLVDDADAATVRTTATVREERALTMSYVSLMGVRQLAMGIVLLTFACQNKWTEVATVLAIVGIVVAGTDGMYLSRAGGRQVGQFHAIPGALIAALACGVIWSGA